MKRGSKKPESDETDSKKPEREEVGTDTPGSDKITIDPDGIDAIRALQFLAGGIAILALVWYVLHNILHII
jgi:hypothetical protein